MANTIRIKRGLESARTGVTPAVGELLYTTDDKKVYLGDGSTAGGNLLSGGGGVSINLVASGAITAGDPCVVNADGTVSTVSEDGYDTGTEADYTADTLTAAKSSVLITSDKVFTAWWDTGDSVGKCCILTINSDETITTGTEYTFNNAITPYIDVALVSSTEVMIAFQDGTNGPGRFVIATISGTTVSSFSSEFTFDATEASHIAVVREGLQNPSAGSEAGSPQAVIAYQNTSGHLVATLWQDYPSTWTFVNNVTVDSTATCTDMRIVEFAATSQHCMIAYVGLSSYPHLAVVVPSVSTITAGTPVVVESNACDGLDIAYNSTDSQALLTWIDGTTGTKNLNIATVDYSAPTITVNSEVVLESLTVTAGDWPAVAWDSDRNEVLVLSYTGNAFIGSISANVFVEAAEFVVNAGASEPTLVYVPTRNLFATAYGGAGKCRAINHIYSTTLTATSYIGISEGTYADAETAAIITDGGLSTNQSGLTAGQRYYVQTNGTLSLTADSPSVSAGIATSATNLLVSKV